MMCQHCQYQIPVSAKTMARREMKEAALQHQSTGGGAGVMAANGVAGAEYDGYRQPAAQQQQQQHYQASQPEQEVTAAAPEADSPERPRQKRKRQCTKKGMTTATEEELAELDEGLSDEEPVSWRKTSGQRRAGWKLCTYGGQDGGREGMGMRRMGGLRKDRTQYILRFFIVWSGKDFGQSCVCG